MASKAIARLSLLATALLATALLAGEALAQEADVSAEEQDLVEKLQNPISDLMSIPFQNNFERGVGPEDDFRYILNFQPVIPFALRSGLTLISRTIVPLVSQPEVAPGADRTFGLGDVLQSIFLSPASRGVIWGIGPVFLFPTATDRRLGIDQWGLGPTAVVLTQRKAVTVGVLANHLWRIGGSETRRELNLTFLQPFLSFAFRGGASLSFNTESTYDWEGEEWTVPLQVAVGQLVKAGRLPMNLQLAGRWWAEGPTPAPEYGIRFIVTFLVPARR